MTTGEPLSANGQLADRSVGEGKFYECLKVIYAFISFLCRAHIHWPHLNISWAGQRNERSRLICCEIAVIAAQCKGQLGGRRPKPGICESFAFIYTI